MSLKDHAESELTRAGLLDADADYDGQVGRAVLELIEVFAKQGHSGMSAAMTVGLFETLARQKPLTPIDSTPEDWIEVQDGLWQNRRDGECFSSDGGQTFYSTAPDDEAHVQELNQE